MVRNDTIFIEKWVNYYGKEFGQNNLFIILDGFDQEISTKLSSQINVINVPHIILNRARGDRNRARLVSKFAQSLFFRYDIVIAMDIDEFLVLDPKKNISLKNYLSKKTTRSSISALGLDVGQHLEEENSIDLKKQFLEQRNYALVSSRYTKPIIAFKPITWGSGFHRVKGKNFKIDKNLYLFHFGMVDFNLSTGKTQDLSRLEQGWSKHLDRRFQLFNLITNSTAVHGNDYFKKARYKLTFLRPFYALNKPGTINPPVIIKIPKRFKKIV